MRIKLNLRQEVRVIYEKVIKVMTLKLWHDKVET